MNILWWELISPERLSKDMTGDEVWGGRGRVETSLEKETEAKSWSSLWTIFKSLDFIQLL